MSRPNIVIENPILNAPFSEPDRYFKFDDDGITDEILEGRRPSTYFVPIPKPRSKGKQIDLEDWTEDRRKENKLVDEIRSRVAMWRANGYFSITGTTRRLLTYWNDPDREKKLFFCQIEALETAIYLTEVAERVDSHILAHISEANRNANPDLYRMAFKMATGSGKTVVMAMLIAWQALNKFANRQDSRFSDAFLIVAPGITIRDRLRVLKPNDPGSYYRERDLLPPDLALRMNEAATIHITNYHAFGLRSLIETSKTNKAVLLGRDGKEEPGIFTESPAQMVRRVLRPFGNKKNIVVLNDEAHHCYRRRADTEEVSKEEVKLKGDERKEAEKREEEARVWISGLEAIKKKLGIKAVYDLSATPFFLRGSGYAEGTLFGWVVSDFSLIDAIESGIVKIPRVPVEDNSMKSDGPTNRKLWDAIRDELPKKGRGTDKSLLKEEPHMPPALEAALESLYNNYNKCFVQRKARDAADGATPPVFIVVCNNTNVSNLIYRYISGYDRVQPDGSIVPAPGKFSLFSNVVEGKWSARPNTILVDSEQLESGDAMSDEFKAIAQREIEEFKEQKLARGEAHEDIKDEELLREVMNTVGKAGKLGEQVRCVVSVSMLTEGWDANTVTHILGVRAFGTQLLCEQVVGRGLRRMSYATNAEGKFEPEYAEVYGVPFSFIPTAASSGEPPPQRKVTHVRHLDDRAALEITFPRLVGYRYEFPRTKLTATFTKASELHLSSKEIATWTEIAGVVGEEQRHTLDYLKTKRMQHVEFELAKTALERYFRKRIETKELQEAGATVGEDVTEHGTEHGKPARDYVDSALFPQVLGITRDWLNSSLKTTGETFPQLVLFDKFKAQAAEKIYTGIVSSTVGEKRIFPRMADFDPIGSTKYVEFDTTKSTYQTEKSHVSHAVCDTESWEQKMAQVLEENPDVICYVKNDHLGFTIPWSDGTSDHDYNPDFIARVRQADGSILNLIIEVTGEMRPEKIEKVRTTREMWVPAVNNAGVYGKWGIHEVKDPWETGKGWLTKL